jgi:hypothetical protein
VARAILPARGRHVSDFANVAATGLWPVPPRFLHYQGGPQSRGYKSFSLALLDLVKTAVVLEFSEHGEPKPLRIHLSDRTQVIRRPGPLASSNRASW